MAAFSQVQCLDFLQFQDALKKMRLLDDTIIYALNVELPTDSFKGQKDCQANCRKLFSQMQESYTSRDNALNTCINLSRHRINELKKQRETDESNLLVQKELRKEQLKVRQLEAEQGVEEVVRARTKKVFYERCRTFYLPENFTL